MGMDFRQHVSFETNIRSGQPCIRGTRIAVSDILEYLGSGMSIAQILEDFPSLTEQDVLAALLFAADLTHSSSRLLGWKYMPSEQLDDAQMYVRDILQALTKIANYKSGSFEDARTVAAESRESVEKVVKLASRR